MELALVLTISLSAAFQGPTRSDVERLAQPAATVEVVFDGCVITPEGRPARGAVVTSSAGGRTLAGADGRFELAVALPLEVECVEVTASLDGGTRGESCVATVRVLPPSLAPL